MFNRICLLAVVLIVSLGCTPSVDTTEEEQQRSFVEVDGTQFKIDGEPYYFVGTNFWYGAYLGMDGAAGDRDRLIRELDLLADMGVTNLRILAASEAAKHDRALTPAFQPAPGEISEEMMVGLDFLLDEMGKRDMRAVVFLTNFWEWSGGMNIYSEWYGGAESQSPIETGDWEAFMNLSAEFYKNEPAQKAFQEYITKVIQRTNTISGMAYNNDPTIMSWQLANEPRPGAGEYGEANIQPWVDWMHSTSAFIKNLAPKQLVSTGSEGSIGSMVSMDNFVLGHDSKNIDYLTFHMWAKNWNWYDATDPETTMPNALANAEKYIREHVEIARQMNKPITMEEFGLGRDGESFDPRTSTTYRDLYFNHVFKLVEESMETGSPLAGTNFWAWGGYGYAVSDDYKWRPGDPLVGDPPQEPQGLNSVFAADSSTVHILREHADYIKSKSVSAD
jgi:mannan endo-1,4-beta-mannosidase